MNIKSEYGRSLVIKPEVFEHYKNLYKTNRASNANSMTVNRISLPHYLNNPLSMRHTLADASDVSIRNGSTMINTPPFQSQFVSLPSNHIFQPEADLNSDPFAIKQCRMAIHDKIKRSASVPEDSWIAEIGDHFDLSEDEGASVERSVNANNSNTLKPKEATNMKLDDSLTNLQWLQGIQLHNNSNNNRASRNESSDSQAEGGDASNKQSCSGIINSYDEEIDYDNINFATDPCVKPPFSYATMICMSMQSTDKPKMTLANIYSWITDNFCYYKHAEPSWQNSIRHNLSLNKCFIKVPRGKNEPGKGGFWKIDPRYADALMSSNLRKRKMTSAQLPLSIKRSKSLEASTSQMAPLSEVIMGKQSPMVGIPPTRESETVPNFAKTDAGEIAAKPNQFEDIPLEPEILKNDFLWSLSGSVSDSIRRHPAVCTDDLINENSNFVAETGNHTAHDDFFNYDILNEIMDMSPPDSIEEFADELLFSNLPVDLSSNKDQPLDLTIHGRHISTPVDYWNNQQPFSPNGAMQTQPLGISQHTKHFSGMNADMCSLFGDNPDLLR